MLKYLMVSAYTLFSASQRAQTPTVIESDVLDAGAMLCTNKFRSSCSLGDTFVNSDPFSPGYEQAGLQLNEQRKVMLRIVKEKSNLLEAEFKQQRKTLFKGMETKVFLTWQDYIKSLIRVAEETELRNNNIGVCDEAAHASIAQSIVKQLETGERENIQLIKIHSSSSGFKGQAAHHAFVIYNSKAIANQDIDNDSLNKIMRNLKSADPMHPVIACDSWINYNGRPDHWLNHFAHNTKEPYTSVKWGKIESKNFSIPSLRDGVSVEQRAYLKGKIKEILDPVIHFHYLPQKKYK